MLQQIKARREGLRLTPNDIDYLIEQAEKTERYENALKSILEVGYSESFGGAVQYSGENHGDCRKIAGKALRD